MREELLHYYERELTFLRRMGAEFARAVSQGRGPAHARAEQVRGSARRADARGVRVSRRARASQDRRRFSGDHARRCSTSSIRTTCGPIPAMSIVEIKLDPEQGKLTTGYRAAARNDAVLASGRRRAVQVPDELRHDAVADRASAAAQWTTPDRLRPPARFGDAAAVLRIELRCQPGRHVRAARSAKTLRFYLDGAGNLTAALYELLNTHDARHRRARGRRQPGPPSPKSDHAAGVGDPARRPRARRRACCRIRAGRSTPIASSRSTSCSPRSISSSTCGGFDAIARRGHGRRRSRFSFRFRHTSALSGARCSRPASTTSTVPAGLHADHQSVSAGRPSRCSLTQRKPGVSARRGRAPPADDRDLFGRRRHRDHAGLRAAAALPAVLRADAHRRETGPRRRAERCPFPTTATMALYWLAKRRDSAWRSDDGTDILLSFVDRTGRVAHPEPGCGHGASHLLQQRSAEPASPSAIRRQRLRAGWRRARSARSLRSIKPTRVIQPPLGDAQTWRLISQLSLNYLSLVDVGGEALRETLRLYDFADPPSARKQIAGIVGGEQRADVRAHRHRARPHVRARPQGRHRVRRGAVHRRRHLSLRHGARALPRPLRVDEQLLRPLRAIAAAEARGVTSGRRAPAGSRCCDARRSASSLGRLFDEPARLRFLPGGARCSSSCIPTARRSASSPTRRRGRALRDAVRASAFPRARFSRSRRATTATRRA